MQPKSCITVDMQLIGCSSQREGKIMFDIRHRVGIAAAPSSVYGQLATTDGLRSWWTTDVRGRAEVGEKLSFHFGGPDRFFVMEVVEQTPDERVVWRCVEGPAEWVDTDFTFQLGAADGETVVLFTHGGWREPVEFMHHCSTKWASYLLGMKHGLEGGRARPYPDDEKISRWD
jgi:uncharacterized protein YndB with AHSA1/START domain